MNQIEFEIELFKIIDQCNNIYNQNHFNQSLENFNYILVYINLINNNFNKINQNYLKNNNNNNCENFINNNINYEYYKTINEISKELLEVIWSDFIHVGDWNNVDIIFKNLYSYSTIFYIFSTLLMTSFSTSSFSSSSSSSSFSTNTIGYNNSNYNNSNILELLDYAILFGDKLFNSLINDFIKLIITYNNKIDNININININNNNNYIINNYEEFKLNSNNKIKIFKIAPTLIEFENEMKLGQPFVIENYINEWPCFSSSSDRNWNNLDYLKRVAGHRVVAIEIGKNYLDLNLKQKLIKFEDFINQHVQDNQNKSSSNDNDIGYLAQTKLLDQIPELKKDIKIPEYCYVNGKKEEDIIINAWFGPKGTVTPLHFDSKDNLLCQVVGFKYIKLFSSKYSNNLYPHSNSKLYFNTSKIDIENIDFQKYPKFKEIENHSIEIVLKPGDILFIPKSFYHFVKSLSKSFSLNYWF